MSDLEKALEWWDDYTERKALMIPTGPFTDILIDAARRQLNLTSPETIEKGALRVKRLWPSIPPGECYQISAAVLRSVEEGET